MDIMERLVNQGGCVAIIPHTTSTAGDGRARLAPCLIVNPITEILESEECFPSH